MTMKDLSSEFIKVSEPFPHVLHVELARKPVNAFTDEFWRAYGALFDSISKELPDVRAVVLSSALPKTFTAGVDLQKAENYGRTGPDDVARVTLDFAQDLKDSQYAMSSTERCLFPVIAAIHGDIIGLGLDITSACDIRYAASNTKFTIKEVDIGMVGGGGTLARLPKISGNLSLVREVAYTAGWFNAAQAQQMGFVSKIVEGGREEVITAALDLAKLIASKSPVAVTGTKKLITHAIDHPVAESLHYTEIWSGALLQTKDMIETKAATKAKRPGKFAPLKLQSKL